MSELQSLDAVLAQAAEQEKKYDWLNAILSYNQALGLVPEQDSFKLGEISERLGFASYRAAMQNDSADKFKNRMREAVANYERAKEFYRRPDKSTMTARIFRCDAMIAYTGYWIASEVPEKKKLIDQCWTLTEQALKAFDEAGDAYEYWRTYDQLSLSAGLGGNLERDFQVFRKKAKEAIELGEHAISSYSAVEDPGKLARLYVQVAGYLEAFGFCFSDLDDRERYFRKAADYLWKANELSEEATHIRLLDSLQVGIYLGLGPGTEKALAVFEKALEYGRPTKDKIIIGWAQDCLAFHNHWKALASEDPDEMVELANKALHYAEDAERCYSGINFVSPRGLIFWVHAPLPEHYWLLALHETDQSKKRDLLEKAKDAAPDQLRRAEASGYPEIMWLAHHALSKVLGGLAKIELNPEKRKYLLEEGLRHRDESISIHDRIEPFDYWNRGMMLNYLANIKYELANLSEDAETSRSMLQEAIVDKENSLKFCIKELGAFERTGSLLPFASIGRWQYEYGDLLNRLYEFTHNPEHLEKSIEAFKDAAESFQKPNLTSRMAECYWKAAQVCNILGEHLKASEYFDCAANSYRKAAENIPQLKTFYLNHALYMEAWTEIEKARHYHARQEYSLAKDHFDKAAQLHASLKQWSYLAPNYAAWAQVELAEELSRKEQGEEALLAFENAAKLFEETKKSVRNEFSKIANTDEKTMARNLIKSADQRREYCMGRIALEEARILDKRGDHYSSSEKYGSAAATFEKIAEKLESEQDLKELRLITTLSRAWQKMTQAETETEPALYIQASKLFEQAKELSSNERGIMLALGHSRFCRALEAGNKFADTRNPRLHSAALRHLESAANYYLKAGFQKASEYAKATELLLDAYLYMDNAKEEMDPEKKAKLYMMAERVLESSAGAFLKAEHLEKREQVLRLLEKVKEERQLALSLTEVLHAPSIVSTTTAFATPTPTRENAVGLERFENADIQVNVIPRQKELKVFEELHLKVEFINAGKCPAFLTKISDLIPESFDIVQEPETYNVEDTDLNLKGKQLKPLKAEEISIVLRPMDKGTFTVRPKIFYLDEAGHEMSCEPEPEKIDVSEVVLPSRVSTGFADLDTLLLGGLPENRVVILTSPPCDERDLLIQSFLKTGVNKGEATFYVTIDASAIRELAQKHQSNFYVFVCNPKGYETMENLPNTFKLRGVENLTEISIALTSAFRRLDIGMPKRACIAIISDVLLQHGALSARKWLAALIPELRSNHFTTLAVMNPQMHPSEGAQAILDLFEGEIAVYEKETKKGVEKVLKIKRLYDQKYLETELPLKKDRL
jgi:KaiC/GvpD/RAD55 family RecA-like ATPase/tetratricopeptide (TPR) repeat protein